MMKGFTMQEKLKMVKAYLYAYLQKNEGSITSIVFEKHNVIESWYYIHITTENGDTLRVLISSSGVISFTGAGNFKTLELMNAINLVLESDYYSLIFKKYEEEIKGSEK